MHGPQASAPRCLERTHSEPEIPSRRSHRCDAVDGDLAPLPRAPSSMDVETKTEDVHSIRTRGTAIPDPCTLPCGEEEEEEEEEQDIVARAHPKSRDPTSLPSRSSGVAVLTTAAAGWHHHEKSASCGTDQSSVWGQRAYDWRRSAQGVAAH